MFCLLNCNKAEITYYIKGRSTVGPTADPEDASSIPAQSYISVEIDHEIISMVILLLPSIQEGLLSVTSQRMCMKF